MDIEDILRQLDMPLTDEDRIRAADELAWYKKQHEDLAFENHELSGHLILALAEEGVPLNPMAGN